VKAKPLHSWLWHRLVSLADRISPEDAFRQTHLRFRFVEQVGIVVTEDTAAGCPLWRKGSEYHRAFDAEEGDQ
jgi:hypothetical protein